MSMPPAKPFGRRGRAEPLARAAPQPAFAARSAPKPVVAPDLPPEVVAAVLGGSSDLRQSAFAGQSQVKSVGWSFRAAVLAGLIVSLVNAAAQATRFSSFGGLDKLPFGQTLLGQISFGEVTVPLTLLAALAGLWSGARASALALLFAHKILARLGHTSLMAYSLGGAAACLAYALLAGLLGGAMTPVSIAMEALSGLGAGFFYRLFAATERG
jgi:hypothetical protein